MKRELALPLVVALLLITAVLLVFAFKGTGGGSNRIQGTTTPKLTLHDAAITGELQRLKEEIARGADVNKSAPADSPASVPHVGATPLMAATGAGNLEAVTLLLQAGAAPDAQADDGWTALMVAANAPGVPMPVLEAILGAGATVDAKNKDGRTALMLAAASGHPDKVIALLNAGASAHATDGAGRTALILAAGVPENAAIVRALLQAGAAPDVADEQGVTALMRAAAIDDVDSLVALLDAGAVVDRRDTAGRSALDYAKAASGTAGARTAQVLLDAGAG